MPPGTYTDLGTTGTAIATANTDDANSAASPLVSRLAYNGTAFTDFVLNTNGLSSWEPRRPTGGRSTPTVAKANVNGPIDGAADTNLLLPFNQDLTAGIGRRHRVPGGHHGHGAQPGVHHSVEKREDKARVLSPAAQWARSTPTSRSR